MRRDADISDCGLYRYWLTRGWGEGQMGAWVMLNPSTADATQDDPTIRRCINFSKAWGWGSLVILNLFALRATDPAELRKADDPVGPLCDLGVKSFIGLMECGRPVVAAWGVNGTLLDRDKAVLAMLAARGVQVQCLGVTKDGHPKHPLYLPNGTALRRLEGID